ncbi:peptidase S8/S53 subtilisin kexin sedolisin [Rhizobium leguminosarum]|nr:peptidase S8/S53 subtilisin kexin sedolisin [Rhizobium leguminosarum]
MEGEMISGKGWELHVERLAVHQSSQLRRTYGRYQAFGDGSPLDGLSGFMCESMGPGNNRQAGNNKRIEAGTYTLHTQFGRYRSIGYSEDTQYPEANAMPGLLLYPTGKRVGILLHPGHPPKLYLSSIGCLNPSKQLTETETMDFWDSRGRVIALIESLRHFDPSAFEHEVGTESRRASVVIDGEPSVTDHSAFALAFAAGAAAEPASLPISKSSAIKCARWMMDNFAQKLQAAVSGRAYQKKHLCAIVCRETAYKWLLWLGKLSMQDILARCVFDASGDYPGTSRSAFPKNTAAFRAKYGDPFTDMLIEEANKTRRLQNYPNESWVYKGYGLFQYDLQNITTDEAFFRDRQWADFDICLAKCCAELDDKLRRNGNDLWKAIRAYNGTGAAAQQYMQNVKAFADYCAPVTGD